ncbi:suppressor of fused homolog [Condylostylus longicornis]|uniref:suppressor of fused homolog n=1 Tax=Condylostylus longicornis TaxID=2530218 RepID=UPI00244DE94A|nr:suppressor of fused homolog [Condylostylus longicornis]XP_055383007.1 suppressor of fused homolog [Condylostylus longicornis]
MQQQPTSIPPGLKTLIDQCHRIYPDQPNPLQVTTILKYWLGGQDPLDYISMYNNRGNVEMGILPHWHYISFGLSDLHGDGRVHVREQNSETSDYPLSGMGFELTFRLLKNPNDERPPTWPANLLQALARYCFQTGNRFCVGDNVPWRKPIDNSTSSLIQHLLIAEDPQLNMTETPFGSVQFCQIVGVTEEELEQASRWNGKGILNYLKRDVTTGGEWLITNVYRTQSLFELFPETLQQLQDDLEKEGSDLAGINAEFTFRELHKQKFKTEIDSDALNEQCLSDENNKFPDTKEICLMDLSVTNESFSFLQSMSISNSLEDACPVNFQPLTANVVPLDGIEITLAFSAAKYLLLSIKDRVRHGRHFTFKAQNLALTILGESVTGGSVNKSNPYGVIGYWVQIMITDDLVPRMMEAFQTIDTSKELTERREFEWPDKNLKVIIDNPIPYNTLKNSS